jgi:penicillin-binding protein 1A
LFAPSAKAREAMADFDANSDSFTIRRNIDSRLARLREGFGGVRRRWWFRILAWALLLAGVGFVAAWAVFARDLPSVEALEAYEPPLPTVVRGGDGTPIHSYARERRVELSYAEFPPMLVRAFMAAEDRNFFRHSGVDLGGQIDA